MPDYDWYDEYGQHDQYYDEHDELFEPFKLIVGPLHFHVDNEGRDCDGRHGSYTVQHGWGPETGRLAWTRYVSHVIRFYGPDKEVTIKRYTRDDGTFVIEFGGPNDEGGYSHTQAYTCTDIGCKNSQYDQYAELMGY
jgi:hypothetical protein